MIYSSLLNYCSKLLKTDSVEETFLRATPVTFVLFPNVSCRHVFTSTFSTNTPHNNTAVQGLILETVTSNVPFTWNHGCDAHRCPFRCFGIISALTSANAVSEGEEIAAAENIPAEHGVAAIGSWIWMSQDCVAHCGPSGASAWCSHTHWVMVHSSLRTQWKWHDTSSNVLFTPSPVDYSGPLGLQRLWLALISSLSPAAFSSCRSTTWFL